LDKKDSHKDSTMSRGQFLKMGLGLALGTAVFGFMGCREQAALGNNPVPMPQVINFVGDTRNKLYHRMTCRSKPRDKNYSVYFDSPVGAQHNGFKPCRVCKPNQI
jgi:hypothetical protein